MKLCGILFFVVLNISLYVQASVANSSYMTSLSSLDEFFTQDMAFISQTQIEQGLCEILQKYSWNSLKRIYQGRIPLFSPTVKQDFIQYLMCISLAESYRQELWQEFTQQQNIEPHSAQDVLQGLLNQKD